MFGFSGSRCFLLVFALVLVLPALAASVSPAGLRQAAGPDSGRDPRKIVDQAVATELAAASNDHARWIYLDVDTKPEVSVRQWNAETSAGTLHRVLQRNGQPVQPAEQRRTIERYIHDSGAQAKARKSEQHDDQQAADLLRLLPAAFLWTVTGNSKGATTLHFKPDPGFHPPSMEARVFAAMEGDMTVDDAGHRIVSLKGRLIRDVKFFGGLFGDMQQGGTFQVERRQVAPGSWQIVETHVHIKGHALLFKDISAEEDEVKSDFHPLPADQSPQDAEKALFDQAG